MNRWFCALVLGLCATLSVMSQEEADPSVGMRLRISQLVLPGPELVAKPLERNTPGVLRIVAGYPHGSDFRYDFEFYGLEAGSYDLRDYLQSKDGSPIADMPPIPVDVIEIRPPEQVVPAALARGALPGLGGYGTLLALGTGAWTLGLLALIFARRRQRVGGELSAGEEPVTLADRLRPLVVQALEGELAPVRQAELERLLLAHWRRRLNLEEMDVAAALVTLREHEEAGVILRKLEAWLHQPPGRAGPVDLNQLLEPYRRVVAA